ncbi:hypothetical protein ABW19_dt0207389 [Dactylella cylindrospora]|nr:hypothetical protein ABW19_dt0207389 [Dactylella cylindrospora]
MAASSISDSGGAKNDKTQPPSTPVRDTPQPRTGTLAPGEAHDLPQPTTAVKSIASLDLEPQDSIYRKPASEISPVVTSDTTTTESLIVRSTFGFPYNRNEALCQAISPYPPDTLTTGRIQPFEGTYQRPQPKNIPINARLPSSSPLKRSRAARKVGRARGKEAFRGRGRIVKKDTSPKLHSEGESQHPVPGRRGRLPGIFRRRQDVIYCGRQLLRTPEVTMRMSEGPVAAGGPLNFKMAVNSTQRHFAPMSERFRQRNEGPGKLIPGHPTQYRGLTFSQPSIPQDQLPGIRTIFTPILSNQQQAAYVAAWNRHQRGQDHVLPHPSIFPNSLQPLSRDTIPSNPEDLDTTHIYTPHVLQPSFGCAMEEVRTSFPPNGNPSTTLFPHFTNIYDRKMAMIFVDTVTVTYSDQTIRGGRPVSAAGIVWGPSSLNTKGVPLLTEQDSRCAIVKAVIGAIEAENWAQLGYQKIVILFESPRLWSVVSSHRRTGLLESSTVEEELISRLWDSVGRVEGTSIRVLFSKAPSANLILAAEAARRALPPQEYLNVGLEVVADSIFDVIGTNTRTALKWINGNWCVTEVSAREPEDQEKLGRRDSEESENRGRASNGEAED